MRMDFWIFLAWVSGSGMVLATALFYAMFFFCVRGSFLGNASKWMTVSLSVLGLTASASLVYALSEEGESVVALVDVSLLLLSGLTGLVSSFYLYSAKLALSSGKILCVSGETKGLFRHAAVVLLAASVLLFLGALAGADLLGYSLLTGVFFLLVGVGTLFEGRTPWLVHKTLFGIVLAGALANASLVTAGGSIGQNLVTSVLFVFLSLSVMIVPVARSVKSSRMFCLAMVRLSLLSVVLVGSLLPLAGFVLQDPHLKYLWAGGGVLSVYTALMFIAFSGIHMSRIILES